VGPGAPAGLGSDCVGFGRPDAPRTACGGDLLIIQRFYFLGGGGGAGGGGSLRG